MNCPSCGTRIEGVVTRGPSDHALDPCGCRATTATVRDFTDDTRPRIATDGGMVEAPDLYPVSVRVEVTDAEVTWHTSDTAYERLANHPSGNLVTNIEDAAKDRDGSLFDVVVASSGAFWIMEVDDE